MFIFYCDILSYIGNDIITGYITENLIGIINIIVSVIIFNNVTNITNNVKLI